MVCWNVTVLNARMIVFVHKVVIDLGKVLEVTIQPIFEVCIMPFKPIELLDLVVLDVALK